MPLRIASPAALAATYALGAAVLAAVPLAWRRRAERSGGGTGLGRGGNPLASRFGSAPPRARLAAAVGLAGALAVLAAAATRSSHTRAPLPGELVVSFLDVGQGDATLLQRAGASVLVDTGPPDGPILRRLAEAGVERLDALLITHAQADHEGAAPQVIREYAPRLVLNGGAGWPTGVQRLLPRSAVPARAGQTLTLGGIRMRLLWPPRPSPGWRPEGDPNGRAVVVLAQVGGFDLLLPADAESDVTGALDLPDVDALKVAHHGSADPGLPALLGRLRPEVAAIEVGRRNTYGHPTAATLSALHTVPRVYRTDRDGTVRLRVRGGAATVERSARRRP